VFDFLYPQGMISYGLR